MKQRVAFKGPVDFIKVDLISPDYEQYADEDYCVEVAKLYCLDHPRFGKDIISTSIVIKKFDDGSFETLNTIYVPNNIS